MATRGNSVTSIKIPKDYYEKIKSLKYSLYLEHCVEASFVEIMKLILDETDWTKLEQQLIKQYGPDDESPSRTS